MRSDGGAGSRAEAGVQHGERKTTQTHDSRALSLARALGMVPRESGQGNDVGSRQVLMSHERFFCRAMHWPGVISCSVMSSRPSVLQHLSEFPFFPKQNNIPLYV